MRRERRRSRRVGVIATLATALLLIPGERPVSAKTCILPTTVDTLRGTAVGNESAEPTAGETPHVIELDTGDETARFLVFGKPERLEIGHTYEAEVYRFDAAGSDSMPVAWLHGDNLCGPNTSIVAVNDDGSTSSIARYPGLGPPISRNEFLAGFAAFAAAVFLMSRLGRD